MTEPREARCCEQESPVGVEIWGDYDGVLFYECAVCHKRWHRFEEGDALHKRAQKYVEMNPREGGEGG